MSAGAVILIVVVMVIVAVVAAAASMRLRHPAAEQQLAGPEYDRLADEVGPRKANAEFAKRRQRVDGLGIKSLSDERRAAYTSQWQGAQEQFVDGPARAVRAARSLITSVAADRGYEVADHDQFLTDLSVYHGRHLDGYRRAWQATDRIDTDLATTEDLRRALLECRALFFDLVESSYDISLEPGYAREQPTAGVPQQRPWKQVTQGRHWKVRQRQGDATLTESEQVAAGRGES